MNLRFFKPNQLFFDWIKGEFNRRKRPIVDCGCGYGHLVRELSAAQLPTIGIDPRYAIFNEQVPEDLIGRILPMEAEHCSMVKQDELILLTCRPCHSGFPQYINNSRSSKSVFYYIGLEKNVDLDLGDCDRKQITDSPVGEDGEHIWQVNK